MPPTLALILCTLFVLYLLWVERKHASDLSHALWVPTIWMLSIASKPLAVWFATAAEDAEFGSPLDQVFLTVILCLGVLILNLRKFSFPRAIKNNALVMLIISYMLVSILWSQIPFISFKRWVRELIAVIMAFLIMTELDPREAMQSILRRTAYILIPFSLLLIKYFPKYGVAYDRWDGNLMWIGVSMQKNGLGRLSLICAFFLFWALVRRWQGSDIQASKQRTLADIFVLMLTAWILKGPAHSYSATSIAGLVVGIATFVCLSRLRRWRFRVRTNIAATTLSLGILFGIVTLFASGSTLGPLTSSLGRDDTLTGRTEVWAELLPIVMQKPILGCGFGSFWTPATREFYNISGSHSGYLDVLLELGSIGLVLISAFLLSSCRRAALDLTDNFFWASLWIGFLFIIVVYNITESTLSSFTSHLTAVLLFLGMCSTVHEHLAEGNRSSILYQGPSRADEHYQSCHL